MLGRVCLGRDVVVVWETPPYLLPLHLAEVSPTLPITGPLFPGVVLCVLLLFQLEGAACALMTAVLKLCLRFRLYNLDRQNVNIRLLIFKEMQE